MAPENVFSTGRVPPVPEQRNVTVIFPSGESRVYPPIEYGASSLLNDAADMGISNFVLKHEDGCPVKTEDYPITQGTIRLEEWNKPG